MGKGRACPASPKDFGKVGNDVGQENGDGHSTGQRQQGRIDERGDQVAPQLIG